MNTFSYLFFFFKQKPSYELRISDWSADVFSSDLCIAFAQDAGKALAIDAALVQHAGQGLLRERELLARLQAFQFGDALLDDLLLAGLHREIRHREGNLSLA